MSRTSKSTRIYLWSFFASHTLPLFPCSTTDGVARNFYNLLIEHARTPFQRVWVQFLCASKLLCPRGKKKKNAWISNFCCRSKESNTSLLRRKQVRYPLHHCLSGVYLWVNFAGIEVLQTVMLSLSTYFYISKNVEDDNFLNVGLHLKTTQLLASRPEIWKCNFSAAVKML